MRTALWLQLQKDSHLQAFLQVSTGIIANIEHCIELYLQDGNAFANGNQQMGLRVCLMNFVFTKWSCICKPKISDGLASLPHWILRLQTRIAFANQNRIGLQI